MMRYLILFIAVLCASPLLAQETPPAPAKPRPVTFPKPVERTLANGLRVIVIPKIGSGLVATRLLLQSGGGSSEDEARAGLADLTASLLPKGTKSRTAPQIAEQIESLGGSIGAGAEWDAATLRVSSVLKQNLEPALVLLADVVQNPTFRAVELNRLRTQTIDDLTVSLGEPGTLARYAAARVVFGSGPYGHPLAGTPESLRRITRADVAAFHRTHFRPDNAILLLSGDITPGNGFAVAARRFGRWIKPPTSLPKPRMAPPNSAIPRAILVIDKPDAGQAAVLLTRPGIAFDDSDDRYRALVANSVLGGNFSSRLNREVRIRRGLSYGAGSGLDPRRGVGPFTASAQTKNETADDVASLLREELRGLATRPLPETELTPRKATLIGDFARSSETGEGLAAEVAPLALNGVRLDALSRYIPRIRAVTAAQVKAFAAEKLSARDARIVIVGDGRAFLADLKKRFGANAVTVIPVKSLDLNRPALK